MARQAIHLLILTLSVTTCSFARPHIVIIVADDLGWNDVSFHGSAQIPTPNLDALAANGLQMFNYYVNPICTPSRSALLTAYYPIHTGLQHDVIYAMQPYGLPLNFTLLPQHLKKFGYATHAVGKWHLGFFKKEYTPTFRGFDTHYGYWVGHEDYYDHTVLEGTGYGLDLRDNMEVDWNSEGSYATELFTKRAISVIKNHNPKQPLFLYLCHLAVHASNYYSPLEAPSQYTSRFPHIVDIKRKLFAGMVAGLDDSVGQVVRALGESRLLNDSIILITTDNGGASGGIDNSAASDWPLRGTKATLWEGGVRGTSLLWSPLLKASSGQTNNNLAHIVDWMPTLYNAAGGDPSDLGAIDGLNLWPALEGSGSWPRTQVLLNIDPVWKLAACRQGKYKLVLGSYPGKVDSWYGPSGRDSASQRIFHKLPSMANASLVAQTLRSSGLNFSVPTLSWYTKHNVSCPAPPKNASLSSCPDPENRPCLFDLEEDPCEINDISTQYPEVLSSMLELLQRYNATSVPPGNKPDDPNADPVHHNFVWTPWMD